MASDSLSTAVRTAKLFDQLGIERGQIAGCMSGDWGQFVGANNRYAASLSIVAPHLNKGVPAGIEHLDIPSLVIAGDQGAPAKLAADLAGKMPSSELANLKGYSSPMWADTIADRQADVTSFLMDFLRRRQHDTNLPVVSLENTQGTVGGIRYKVTGSGPPLVLFPLSLAPSQWAPIRDELAQEFCVIDLGGAHVGAVSMLEARAKSGYGKMLGQLVQAASLNSGDQILEVGCGTGALARFISRATEGQSSIVATDFNPYLLSEANNLASTDGLTNIISFQEADAEALPFDDARFDVSLSCTVMEEGDADRMISELARVTKPGGKIIAAVRATDIDWWVNVALSQEDRKILAAFGPQTGAGVGNSGCAGSDLYGRLIAAGLSLESIGPRFALYRDGERLDDVLDRLAGAFDPQKRQLFREAADQAIAAGTIAIGEPFHCAIANP